MANYALNYGNHPTTPTELPAIHKSMTQAILEFNRLMSKFKRVTLHRLNYGDDGKVESRTLLKCQGTPVDGMTKVKLPVPKVTFTEDSDHWCWVCEHSTIGIRVLANSNSGATLEFIKAMKLEAGSSDLPVKLAEYEGEFFYGAKRG